MWEQMCPAQVYEARDGHVEITASNCVQCGAITAKGGRLTPPEGGPAPSTPSRRRGQTPRDEQRFAGEAVTRAGDTTSPLCHEVVTLLDRGLTPFGSARIPAWRTRRRVESRHGWW